MGLDEKWTVREPTVQLQATREVSITAIASFISEIESIFHQKKT